jgi:hypothetical protein
MTAIGSPPIWTIGTFHCRSGATSMRTWPVRAVIDNELIV